MKVSGFTIIRNAVKYGFPVVESIKSILPVCDEFVVNVGKSDPGAVGDDNTLELIKSINDERIRIIETVWDDALREGGRILAVQTNIALKECRGDWAFYIQSDEAVHEKDLGKIRNKMKAYLHDKSVDGFIFNYVHFYGGYYTRETGIGNVFRQIRVVRNVDGMESVKDAASFSRNGKKLRAVDSCATVYHYGWVRQPEEMLKKHKHFDSFWHDDEYIKNKYKGLKFVYEGKIGLKKFTGTHPAVMGERIRSESEKKIEISGYRFKSFRSYLEFFLCCVKRFCGLSLGEPVNFSLLWWKK